MNPGSRLLHSFSHAHRSSLYPREAAYAQGRAQSQGQRMGYKLAAKQRDFTRRKQAQEVNC